MPSSHKTGGRVVRASFGFVLFEDGFSEAFQFIAFHGLVPSRRRWSCLTVVNTSAACGPPITEIRLLGHMKRNLWVVGTAAHAVVAGTVRTANDDGELGNVHAGDGGDQFCTVFGDATRLVGLSNHEPGDVLKNTNGTPRCPHSSTK